MADVAFQFELDQNTVAGTSLAARPATTIQTENLNFEAATTVEQFRELRADWECLARQVSGFTSIFQDFAWLSHWLDSYHRANQSRRQLAIVVGRKASGEVALIAPLQLERRGGFAQLCWMGCPVAQYGDILVVPGWDFDANIHAALAFAIQSFKPDVVRLCKVREDSHLPSVLPDDWAVLNNDVAFELDFQDAADFAEYEKRYSSKARKNRRRLLRRLNERHQVEFHRHEPGEEAAQIALRGLELKRSWLKKRGLKSSALEDKRVDDLMAALAADPESGCFVYSLRCDDRQAGVQIGFQRNGRVELYLIVFDLEFEKAGVGTLQLEDTFRAICDQGHHCVDLLAPDAAYKREWADREFSVSDYALLCTVAGRAFTTIYLMGLRKLLKQAQERLPLRMRTALLSLLR